MKTIKIEFQVTQAEYNLLVAAKSEAPHPDRIRAMLVHDAARLLRRMGDDAIEALRQGQREAIRREQDHRANTFYEPASAIVFPVVKGKTMKVARVKPPIDELKKEWK